MCSRWDGCVNVKLRKTEEKSKDSSSKKKEQRRKNESGSITLNRMKDGSKSKMESGSKDLCGDSTGKKNSEKTNNKDITFIAQQKNMGSMHSSENIEDMVCELEGYRWDAILLSETWRQEKSEIRETHHKHKFMGAGKYDNKHSVGIMLNKSWRQRIIDTEYIKRTAITATIVVNRQRIKLIVCTSPTRDMRTITSKKCTKRSRSIRQIAKDAHLLLVETSMQNWELVTEPNA